MRILIAEDELALRKIICLYLENAGYEVDLAKDGKEALEMLHSKSYDLLIADWMMPHMSGLDLCKEIRSTSMQIKIIMLTAKSENESEIAALTIGVDDFIRKPFEPKILILRIQKMLEDNETLVCGNLTVNLKRSQVFNDDVEIILTQKEWLLIELLIRNKGVTLTREVLLDRVWGNDYDGDERTIDTHILRLRNKIGKNYIKTHIGMGYRMDCSNE